MAVAWVRVFVGFAAGLAAPTAPAQSAIPVPNALREWVLAPAVDGEGATIAFGAGISPGGAVGPLVNVYAAAPDGSSLRLLTQPSNRVDLSMGAYSVSISTDGKRIAYISQTSAEGGAKAGEQVHVIDVATAADRVVHLYTEGCIQPLCIGCYSPCVHEPHFSADGGKMLFAVSHNPSFFVVNVDGTGSTQLPVYSGSLAGPAARVISRAGQVVFTSAAPDGPTFAAAPSNVYTMNLDGSGIRAVTDFGTNPNLYARNATISADGSTIAFETNFAGAGNAPSSNTQVWVASAVGTGLRPLSSGAADATHPTLSGDGSLLAFAQKGQIWITRSGGSGLQVLTSYGQSVVQDPVLNDGGSLVVFGLGPYPGQRGAILAVGADGGNLRTVYAPPALSANGITGATGYSPPSAGSLISVYGANFGADTLAAAGGYPLPRSLAGVSLLVNGDPVPILALTPWQINAQLPPETAEGAASFQVLAPGGRKSAAVSAEVKSLAPQIFAFSEPAGSGGYLQAAVFHAGTALSCGPAHPAATGEIVEIYGTGLGATSPVVAAGMAAPASPPAVTVVPPLVIIGGQAARVVFAGLTPGMAGVYQVNAVIPSGLKPGNHSINWSAGSVTGISLGSITLR